MNTSSALLLVVLLVATVMLVEMSPDAPKARFCGKKLLKFLMNVCDGECTVDSGDLLTRACTNQMTREEIVQQCCPDRILDGF